MGPDAARYLHAGQGNPVARPFNLRFLLPQLCRDRIGWWRAVWVGSWPVLVASMTIMGSHATGSPWRGLAASLLLITLPGMFGPSVVRPVGVDLPSLALGTLGAALIVQGGPWVMAGVVVVGAAAGVKETAPIWAACLAWSWIPLVGLVVPAMAWLIIKPGLDPVSAHFSEITEHPLRTGLEFHRYQWRDAWLMILPWGACLAALYHPTWQVAVVLVLAYGQLLVATDTVRLFQTAAGPTLALAAARVVPVPWLALLVAVHVCWVWSQPETKWMHRG